MSPDLRPVIGQRDLQKCVLCGEGMMHQGLPAFYRITVEHFVLDLRAVQRQHGLEQFMGSAALAFHMGPQEDLAKRPGDAETAFVCAGCTLEQLLPLIGAIDERRRQREEKAAEEAAVRGPDAAPVTETPARPRGFRAKRSEPPVDAIADVDYVGERRHE